VSEEQAARPGYFVPNVESEKPLPLEPESVQYEDRLSKIAENGVIKLRVENDVVVDRIAHDIYADWRSGFRETYANAVTACLVAKETFGASPSIVVTLDPANRSLEIAEKDSLGISVEIFQQVYTVIGRSGNFESGKLGQFGFGRVAYVTIADRVVIKTRYRSKDGEVGEYAVEGKNGRAYVVLPQPKMEGFGTTVKMIVRNTIELYDLARYIFDCCKFSGVPTYLDLKADIQEEGFHRTKIDMGLHHLSKTYEEEADEETKSYSTWDKLRVFKDFFIQSDDFEVFGRVVMSGDEVASTHHGGTYILGVPVKTGLELPFSIYFLNIKNERKFQPTADRERLKEQTEKQLKAELLSKLRENYSFLNAGSIAGYKSLPKELQSLLLTDRFKIEECLDEETGRLRDLLNDGVRVRGGSRETLTKIVSQYSESEVFFEEERFDPRRIKRVTTIRPRSVFIIPNNRNGLAFQTLRKNGILSAKEFVAQNELNKVKMETEYVVHSSKVTSWGWDSLERAARQSERCSSIEPDVLKVPQIGKYLPLLSVVPATFRLTAERKSLAGHGRPLSAAIEEISSKRITTSKGEMTVAAILKYGSIRLSLYSDPSFARFFRKQQELLVLADVDTTFQVMLFLEHHSHPYEADLGLHGFFDQHKDLVGISEQHWKYSRYYEWQLGDSEIMLSVLQVAHSVGDQKLREIFLEALSLAKSGEKAKEMREKILSTVALLKNPS